MKCEVLMYELWLLITLLVNLNWNGIELRGYLPSFFILDFAPLAPQLWGGKESILF